jgi:cobalt-zinc-cadmium efflux system membrane fusion protein
MEIVDNTTIHCDLTVYEADLYKVKSGQQVRFTLTNNASMEFYGEVFGINKSFEDAGKGIIVHCIIKGANKYGLIPGTYVTALISVGTQLSPSVPVDAVINTEGRKFVYVLTEKDTTGACTFKRAEIAIGVTELGYVQISPVDSIARGSKVVTKGAFYLLSKSKGGGEEE